MSAKAKLHNIALSARILLAFREGNLAAAESLLQNQATQNPCVFMSALLAVMENVGMEVDRLGGDYADFLKGIRDNADADLRWES